MSFDRIVVKLSALTFPVRTHVVSTKRSGVAASGQSGASFDNNVHPDGTIHAGPLAERPSAPRFARALPLPPASSPGGRPAVALHRRYQPPVPLLALCVRPERMKRRHRRQRRQRMCPHPCALRSRYLRRHPLHRARTRRRLAGDIMRETQRAARSRQPAPTTPASGV